MLDQGLHTGQLAAQANRHVLMFAYKKTPKHLTLYADQLRGYSLEHKTVQANRQVLVLIHENTTKILDSVSLIFSISPPPLINIIMDKCPLHNSLDLFCFF